VYGLPFPAVDGHMLTEDVAQRKARQGSREETHMLKKCVACDILLDVPCPNTDCRGHQNESVGDLCVYCATNERERLFFVRTLSDLLHSSLADCESDWTGQEEPVMLET
jgi:hypothetical protein